MVFYFLYNNIFNIFLMTLNEHIIKLSKYSMNFSTVEDYIIVSMSYPKSWTINKPLNSEIKFKQIEDRYFYAISISSNIDDIFDAIYETIDYNKEVEEKTKLFKEKIEELKNIFAYENIDILKKMEFKLPKKRIKKAEFKSSNKEEKVENNNTDSTLSVDNNEEIDNKIIQAIAEKEN